MKLMNSFYFIAVAERRCVDIKNMSFDVDKIYEENLLNEIEVAFNDSDEDNIKEKDASPRQSSYVKSAIQLYEQKLTQLFKRKEVVYKSSEEIAEKESVDDVKSESQSKAKQPIVTPKGWNGSYSRKTKYGRTVKASNKKLFNIAKELVKTEESYVEILYLLDQIFFKKVLEEAVKKNILPTAEVKKMFPNISAIYHLHSQFLLPQLKERINDWKKNPRIDDIMIQVAPFLKMYSLYVQHLKSAQETVTQWMEKSPAFSKLIHSIQAMPQCKNLNLQHHMLAPIQRTPRYQLLLETYLKNLPSDSIHREETNTALEMVKIAASHSNEYVKSLESHQKALDILSEMDNIDFPTNVPTRILIKEGHLTLLDGRNGSDEDRYVFLFSDIVLSCNKNKTLRPLRKNSYRIIEKIDIAGMTVIDLQHSSTKNVFCAHGIQYSVEYACKTAEEKVEWIQAFIEAISDQKENISITRHNSLCSVTSSLNDAPREVPAFRTSAHIALFDAELGKRAPHWVRLQEVTLCMICCEPLNPVTRRPGHCRACGQVFCSKCPSYNCTLEYDCSNQLQKVCERCFAVITLRKHDRKQIGTGEEQQLKVAATRLLNNCLLSEYLNYIDNKTITRLWCVVSDDISLSLYCYKACKDVKAQIVVNLVGSEISLENGTSDNSIGFKICDESEKEFVFYHDDFGIVTKWNQIITEAINEADEGS